MSRHRRRPPIRLRRQWEREWWEWHNAHPAPVVTSVQRFVSVSSLCIMPSMLEEKNRIIVKGTDAYGAPICEEIMIPCQPVCPVKTWPERRRR